MSVSSGFYNSLNGDRKYNAEQMSAIFDGIITEGVYENYGDCFKIRIDGLKIFIGTGRAWLNSKWLLNDEEMSVTLPSSDPTFPRYDAVIIDMNADTNSRSATITVESGAAASNPVKPVMQKTQLHKQYPLCYIYRAAGKTNVSSADVEITIGKAELPYVTAPLKMISIDQHFAKWDGEFKEWFETLKNVLDGNTVTLLNNKIDTAAENISKNASNIETNRKNIEVATTGVNSLTSALSDLPLTSYGYRKMAANNTDIDTGRPLTTGCIYAYFE